MGRPVNQAKIDEIRRLQVEGVPVAQIAQRMGVSREAIYRMLRRAEEREAAAEVPDDPIMERRPGLNRRWLRANLMALDMSEHPERYPDVPELRGKRKMTPNHPDVLRAVLRVLNRDYGPPEDQIGRGRF